MIILLDVDGVLRPFLERCEEVFKKYHPEYNDVNLMVFKKSTDIFDNYPGGRKYARNFIFNEHTEEIFLESSPYPTAKQEYDELVHYCADHSHQIIITTSQTTYELKKFTIEWLHKNGFLTKNLAFIEHGYKQLVAGDILIDDEVRNLNNFANHRGHEAFSVCYNREWNNAWEGTRISSLQEIIPILKILRG